MSVGGSDRSKHRPLGHAYECPICGTLHASDTLFVDDMVRCSNCSTIMIVQINPHPCTYQSKIERLR